jgi:hypothetical protein
LRSGLCVKKTAPILFVLGLFCAGAQAAWVKEGATAEDLKRDQSECERKARADTAFNSPQPMRGAGPLSGTRSANNMAKEDQSFRLCMKSRGYADSSGK